MLLGSSGRGSLFLGFAVTPALAAGTPTPNDPDFTLQWGLHNIGQVIEGHPGVPGADIDAPAAWDIHPGASPVVVAVVGRGIDPHPEFEDRLREGYSLVGDPFNTLDSCPHDTHLAGIIAARRDDGVGVAGLNDQARLLPVRVLDGCGGTEAATAEGIKWAVDQGADILLVPVQFYGGTAALEDAVSYAVAHDALVIAPVGRDQGETVAFPAAFDGCLAVSATTNQDARVATANYGAEVDLSAPGQDIWSTWTGSTYAYQPAGRETASASAYVAGVAALLRSYAPQLTASEVRQVLIDAADDLGDSGWDMYFGAGRLNAQRALKLAPPPAVRIERVEVFPRIVPPNTSSSFSVRIVGVAEALLPGSAQLAYRYGMSGFIFTPLTHVQDDLYEVPLPAVPCGSMLEYYLTASGDAGTVVTEPRAAPAAMYAAEAIIEELLFADDFEFDLGWEIEGGDGTSGRWSRVEPVGTSVQPEYDYSPDAGQYCYVTGQHFGGSEGSNDVDGGPMRLTSPVIPLTSSDAEISYALWFQWNGAGVEDFLTVDFSRDGGESWTVAEIVSSSDGWVAHSFQLGDFPGVAGDQLRVRFSASDSPSDSLTEAAVDDFRVRALSCSAANGDVNGDGVVDWADYQSMDSCWTGPYVGYVDSQCAPVDFNADDHVDLRDYQEFQSAFDPG